jgi:hypothetical protein
MSHFQDNSNLRDAIFHVKAIEALRLLSKRHLKEMLNEKI